MGIPLLAPAAVGLGKLGAGLLGGTAVAGTGTALLNAIPTFKETFGQTNEAQAKNEQYNRTALPGEKIDRDGLEKFMDFFTGRDASEIERLALERDNARIKSNVAQNYNLEQIQKNIKNLKLSQDLLPTLKDNQTEQSYTNKLDRAKSVIRDATLAQVRYPGINLRGLDETGLAKAVGQKEREKELKLERKEEARYGDTRKDKSDAMILALLQNQSSNKRIDNQMQLQMMQQDYNNRRLDLQEARDFRRERQAAIMQIMKGFSEMGKAFAY